jgi:imidazolonepropionase-like amidohydrolase
MRIFAVIVACGAGFTLAGVAMLGWLLFPPAAPVPPREAWVFRDVTLVEAGRAARPASILAVDDGRIETILAGDVDDASGSILRGADAHEAPDLAGLYVVPGLVDMHVHYPPTVAVGNDELWSLLLLAHGVTAIRETGSIDGSIFEVREEIRSGRRAGPRIFACGPMVDGGPPSFPSNLVVSSPAEARTAVQDVAAQGADCIKAYNMLGVSEMDTIRTVAREAGLPVIGHAPHAVPFEDTGIVDLQHGTGAVEVDRARVGRSDFLAADWRTMDRERIAHVARVSLARDIAHTPTLVNAHMRRLLADSDQAGRAMEEDSGLRHLPRFWTAAWAGIWDPPFDPDDPASVEDDAIFRERQARMTADLHASGVRIHAGTDTLMPYVAPGSALHGELSGLVDAGLPWPAVFAIATRKAGHMLAPSTGLGTLEVGAPADLLFLRENPAEHRDAFRTIEAVLADGRLYRRSDLDARLAASDAHFRGPLYETVMVWLIALVRDSFAPADDARPAEPPGAAQASGHGGDPGVASPLGPYIAEGTSVH